MTTLIERTALFLFLVLIVACSPTGKPGVSLSLSADKSVIGIEFKNASKEPIDVDAQIAISGLDGGGNLLLLPISEDGIIYRVCSYIDAKDTAEESARLAPGATSFKTISSVALTKKMYCLPSGSFYVSALYFDQRGNRFHSDVLKINF